MTVVSLARSTCRDDARKLLLRHNHRVREIVAVDRDSILYVTEGGQPRTAWLHRTASEVRIKIEHGFQAFPPENWHTNPPTPQNPPPPPPPNTPPTPNDPTR